MNKEEQQRSVYRAMAEFTFNKPSPPTWVSACLRAKEMIESIPELKEWAMKKWNLVPNGTVNIATLQSKKRAPLIITEKESK